MSTDPKEARRRELDGRLNGLTSKLDGLSDELRELIGKLSPLNEQLNGVVGQLREEQLRSNESKEQPNALLQQADGLIQQLNALNAQQLLDALNKQRGDVIRGRKALDEEYRLAGIKPDPGLDRAYDTADSKVDNLVNACGDQIDKHATLSKRATLRR